ncbi:hypothetical protein ACFOQL_05450 [Neisseria perflava]|uniref:hypothetical protein n=1 Tax=Neisseria perflava TaxID=33053 RepID=UPI00361A1F8B
MDFLHTATCLDSGNLSAKALPDSVKRLFDTLIYGFNIHLNNLQFLFWLFSLTAFIRLDWCLTVGFSIFRRLVCSFLAIFFACAFFFRVYGFNG